MAVTRPALLEGTRPAGVFTRHDIHGDTILDADVVVIGSGAGGATIAAELAEAGFEVVVVEEGSYFQTRDFSADTSAMVRQLYRDGGATMALGNPPILYQEGIAVGGSTVINGGMSWRTPAKILHRWEREFGLAGITADLEAHFARVEKRIHVAPMDPEVIGNDNHLLKKGADAKGWNIIGNLRNQAHCAGSNRCAFGCPTGAKQSSLVSYIPRALHFGARVYADVRVDEITRHGKRATGVIGTVKGSGHQLSVRAKLVVSACGAIHTPALLARSGFRSPSGNIGHNLSMHPNVKVVAIYDEPVSNWKGAHQAFQVREFHEQGLVFAAVGMPPSVLAMSFPHRGAQLGTLMDRYDHMMLAGMLCEDTATGRVRTINGKPQAFYQLNEPDAANLQRGTALLSELLFAAGAKQILLPFHGAADLYTADDARRLLDHAIPARGWEVVTVHMMGTARMGTDRTRDVTDPHGLVHDVDRLMVADASLFPTPIGVNPMETIMALATRNAAFVIDNAKRFLS
ncbi:MAG: GMC family oxidoreductase [Deltaproteobacteria bacterium]|nr:GMC family oxidoreductase [Deltaproteobacteria bacterium]MDQ3297243.1 GMC family oxidoreductase [Myxococcota bacterium]